ncbi:MAG TPA: hypothetical protein VMF13_06665 [Luteitalea sp.]|nr:hypothetical protein [Luteitalea sp.]
MADPREDARRQRCMTSVLQRGLAAVGLLLTIVVGPFVQLWAWIGMSAMFGVPPPPRHLRRDDARQTDAVHRFIQLHWRSGVLAYRVVDGDMLFRLPGETLTTAQMQARFPDLLAELAYVRASASCRALIVIDERRHLCVRWERAGRVGGLTDWYTGDNATALPSYGFGVATPVLDWEWIRTRYWSANRQLLDDWEHLPAFQDMPPVGSVVAPLEVRTLEAEWPPLLSRRYYGAYNTTGFNFSTALSRATADYVRLQRAEFDARPSVHDIQPALLEPYIEIIATAMDRRAPADRRTSPRVVDEPVDIDILPPPDEGDRVLSPQHLSVRTDNHAAGGRGLVATFDHRVFKQGWHVRIRYSSGRTAIRTISLNGVR